MRTPLVAGLMLVLASAPSLGRADVQSFYFHLADPPAAVPGGPTSYVIDTSAPSAAEPRVFEQTTAKGETTVFPTFTSTPFDAGTTLLPIASVRLSLAANQKMRSCATPGASLFAVGTNGALTPIGGTIRTEASVPQGSSGGTDGTEILRIEFPLTDTTLAAGESFAVAPSLTNDCAINRRTFLAYDGHGGTSGVRFQCCFTTATKCAAKKMRVVSDATRQLLHEVERGSGRGQPVRIEEVVEQQEYVQKKFARLDALGQCPTTGDAAALSALSEAFAAAVDTALDPLGPGRRNSCQKYKIAGAKTRAACGLKLEYAAAQRGLFLDPDPVRLEKCRAKLAQVFAKREAKGGCDTTGDLDAIEAAVHAFVTNATARLACPCP